MMGLCMGMVWSSETAEDAGVDRDNDVEADKDNNDRWARRHGYGYFVMGWSRAHTKKFV